MRSRHLTLVASLATMIASASETTSWEKLPSAPLGIGNCACSSFGDDLIFAGGITWQNDTKVWLDKVWRFDTKTQIWSEAGHLPHPLAYPAYGQTTQGMFVVSGGDGKRSLSESARLNPKLQYQKIEGRVTPLVYSGSALVNDKLYVVAGMEDATSLTSATNLFYSVQLKTGRVEKLADFPGGKIIVATAAAVDGHVYVFGGASFDATNAVNVDSAFVYSIAEAKWRRIKPFPFSIRGLSSCVLDDRHILLAGGYRQDFTDEAFIYDTMTDAYAKAAPLPYRAMVSLIRKGNAVYCLGGEDRMRHRSDQFYRIAAKALLKSAIQP